MLEELIPLYECGCNACLRQVAKNYLQLGEELEQLLDQIPGGELLDDHGHPPTSTGLQA